ncbi:MAG: glycoside hydrolase family 130 protein [Actinomycetota bacterium]|nr:glycoside hydrolase family 130 protein [Actinomycetota bacterium]
MTQATRETPGRQETRETQEPQLPRTPQLVRRGVLRLTPDPTRVLALPFLPGQEMAAGGISRAEAVLRRVVALPPVVVAQTLERTLVGFGPRHPDLRATLREHFALVAHRVPDGVTLSSVHEDLIGAYVTQEYAVEGAAVCNPSVIADPDQSGAGPGELRMILSVRGIGEGHLSTIGFRRCTLHADGEVTLDQPSATIGRGRTSALAMSLTALRRALSGQGDVLAAETVLAVLPAHFTPQDLEQALASSELDNQGRQRDGLIDRIRRIAASHYRLVFPDELPLSGRVLYPASPSEARGMEDARFTTFTGPDGTVTHYATYTAYDGVSIAPQLIRTDDFRTFLVRPQTGRAATNKGMALFPRLVGGRYWALSRWDRENLSVTSSDDAQHWDDVVAVQHPALAWDLVQLGACASPVETPHGWLVVTHGVGPMRSYSLGAVLLDLDDPRRVLAVLDEPLMSTEPDERDGYVPNVVYSCGALVHDGRLVLPYGCSDASIRFAAVDLAGLMGRLLASPSA